MRAHNRLRSRLQLESLEDRAVPTTFNIANGDVTALLAAVNAANGNNEPDTINLAAGGVYSLSAGSSDRVLTFLPDANHRTTVNGNGAIVFVASLGTGVVEVQGQVTIDTVTVGGGNVASTFVLLPYGGGILVRQGGNLDLRNSTITGNRAFSGGGIAFADGASGTITNCTISGNSAEGGNGGGGGIFIFGGGSVSIFNSTIAFNSAVVVGGGLLMVESQLGLLSTIVAKNLAPDSPDLHREAGTLDARNSLIQSIAPGAINGSNIGNITGVDPILGPLASNGGPTQTHALLAGSPAINTGANLAGLATDQRGPGFARVVGLATDIGAFEDQTQPPPPPPPSPLPPISTESTAQSLQAAAQIVQTLQRGGAKLAAFAFGETSGDTTKDIVLAFRQRNGKLLIATLSGANGGVVGAFQPFPRPLATNARVQLVLVNVNADPALEIGVSIDGGGTGIPRVSAFTVKGGRVL
jgi:Right handed beta helix region